jgi:PAS domain S-box-containing protein
MAKLFFWKKWSLALKLTLAMTTMIVIFVASVTVLSIRREQQTFRAELQQQADLLLSTLAVAAADPLYTLDSGTLSDMMAALGEQILNTDRQILASGRVYNAQGRIIGDAYDPMLEFSLESDPFGQQLINSETTVFEWRPDQLLAGRAVVVGSHRLGAVSVGLSTAPLQAKVAAVRNQGLGVALATVIVGGLLATLFSRSITGPLQELVKVTERIAGGDLTQKIAAGRDDEFAILSQAMENMRFELQTLYLGLEQQVAERTQALQESEKRFRQVISSISDYIYMLELTEDGRRISRYISPNVELLTGYSAERIKANETFWQSTIVYPDDRVVVARQLEHLSKGQNSVIEYRLIQADHNIVWVRDSGRVEKDPDSRSIFVYGVVSDITERKRAEEEQRRFANQLRIAADVSRQLNAILDPDLLLQRLVTQLQAHFDLYHVHVYLLNEATHELIIHAGSGEAGWRLRQRVHKIPLEYERSLVAQAARSREIVRVNDVSREPNFLQNPLLPETRAEVAVPLVASDQVLGVLDVQDNRVHRFSQADLDIFSTLSGQIATALENARLFAERKQVEKTLALARDQALEASHLKSQLLAKVSHELRTPLGAILGYTELLQDGTFGPLSEQQQGITAEVIDSTQYLTDLVSELLDQAQFETGQVTLKVSQFAPQELMHQVEAKMGVLARAKELTLTFDIVSDIPPILSGDQQRLQQILVNLVSNAIKFTNKGAVQVRLYCSNPKYWAMEVSDTGSGIPFEAQAYIFEPFRQVDNSMTRENTGTGLGLSIVKQLATLMGGEITLESEVGRGSTFTVQLPLKPIPEGVKNEAPV